MDPSFHNPQLLAAFALSFLIGFGAVIAIMRTMAPHTRTRWDDRWWVRLMNLYAELLKFGAKLRSILRRKGREK